MMDEEMILRVDLQVLIHPGLFGSAVARRALGINYYCTSKEDGRIKEINHYLYYHSSGASVYDREGEVKFIAERVSSGGTRYTVNPAYEDELVRRLREHAGIFAEAG